MKNFILHENILSVEVKMNEKEYIIAVKWLEPEKPYADTWELVSYANKSTGEKDLTSDEISAFLDTVNANWNWHVPKDNNN